MPTPTPYGCSWCDIDRRRHGLQWIAVIGTHQWAEPTQRQIKQRMIQRRADRLATQPTDYHAYITWDDDGFEWCTTCLDEDCPRYWRIRRRLAERRAQLMAARGTAPF